MELRVDPAAVRTIADQLADQLEDAVLSGRLAPGDALPPANELARKLVVNPRTVAAAYKRLQQTGLAERQSGQLIARAPEEMPRQVRRDRLVEAVGRLLREARWLGCSAEEVMALVAECAAATEAEGESVCPTTPTPANPATSSKPSG